jgi:hypothetical protein
MIRSRLSNASLYLKIITLLLPACAYFIAVKIRFGFNFFFTRTHPAGPMGAFFYSPPSFGRLRPRSPACGISSNFMRQVGRAGDYLKRWLLLTSA